MPAEIELSEPFQTLLDELSAADPGEYGAHRHGARMIQAVAKIAAGVIEGLDDDATRPADLDKLRGEVGQCLALGVALLPLPPYLQGAAAVAPMLAGPIVDGLAAAGVGADADDVIRKFILPYTGAVAGLDAELRAATE